jgi:hypothetical protein
MLPTYTNKLINAMPHCQSENRLIDLSILHAEPNLPITFKSLEVELVSLQRNFVQNVCSERFIFLSLSAAESATA